jgi:predicted secreted Zn-dependent protease
MLTACGWLSFEPQTIAPAETRPDEATLQPSIPSPVPASPFPPEPIVVATATSFTSQVSIEYAQIIYYDATGSTADEIRASMNELRPKDPYDNNKPVDAYTDWYISWNWPGYGTDNCDLSAADVTYSIKVTVPRWSAPADASPELIAKWENYIQRLTLHEKGHVDHIVNNYLSVKTAIQRATCSTAETEAQKALVPLREFDASYDSETKHGESQGAVFP